MAPVTFLRSSKNPVQPYYINPWYNEREKTGIPLLDVLRGDFFCMPFGVQNNYRGEQHPVHGESVNSTWSFESLDKREEVTVLTLSLRVKARPGKILKKLFLLHGQNIVYCQHILDGFKGKTCLSHHATLAVPENPESVLIDTSTFKFGMVVPRINLLNTGNEYYFLDPDARFRSLDKVPTIWKNIPFDNCSILPCRYGFMDLVAFFAKPGRNPAWITATVP